MPYLLAACDIYAAPSRLEGFGMIQVEANACAKPVIGIKAMGMLDTMIHESTALLAGVATEIHVGETILGEDAGFVDSHRIVFEKPRLADYRASVYDIADYLLRLMEQPELRNRLGREGRENAVTRFDYRVVAKQFVDLISAKLGIQ